MLLCFAVTMVVVAVPHMTMLWWSHCGDVEMW